MTIQEFREKIKPFDKLSVEGRVFNVEEIIRFRFDDGNFYTKCILSDGYVFADDLENNMFMLVKDVKTLFVQPFTEELDFDGKKFKFLFSAHAIAEMVEGKKIWKKGYAETFWDYKAEDGSYLSLGVDDNSKERLDFYGKIINPELVQMYDSGF